VRRIEEARGCAVFSATLDGLADALMMERG
jgi:hypothetical protein